MLVRIFFIAALAALTVPSPSGAETLSELLRTGKLEILSMSGNGSSSGAALEGQVFNPTSAPLSVDVHLLEPIYFRNLGQAQNMIATRVYEADGGYFVLGDRAFIEVPAGEVMEVLLVAYCADFELDNPGRDSRFVMEEMPPELLDTARKVAAYEASRPDEDAMVALQLAVWLAQGVSPARIERQFTFSPADLSLARLILR